MRLISALCSLAVLAACQPSTQDKSAEEETVTEVDDPQAKAKALLEEYAPTELIADVDALPESERAALVEILKAAELMDEIFLRQAAGDEPALQAQAMAAGGAVAEAYEINFGPWDRLADYEPFFGDFEHPEGAGYYPAGMSEEEFNAWIEAHPDDEVSFKSLTTVIRRDGESLVAIPYSEHYAEWLEPAAEHLRAAAALTENESLATFLASRAEAFATDDYFQSDMDWMDLDAPVEITIGPYEVYEDGLFGYKAAFVAFVTLDVPEQSAALARYKERLPWLERNLPIPDEHKNFDRGAESPIRVVDEVFVGGDSKAGVQTLAFNLPNDERVREAKGSKKVMLRNVLQAKYDRLLVPIAERTLAPGDAERVDFDAFFNQVLQHELGHGLGPGVIEKNGEEIEVRLVLKELYTTLEEAKADVMGVYNILALIEEGEIDAAQREFVEPTYVAGLFRSARFGLHEAHGRGTVAQFNYLLEKGALSIDDEGRFATVADAFPDAIRDLLAEMLMLQATGDYDATAAFLNQYGVATPELESAIDKLDDLPTDIVPRYPTAEALLL